MKLTINTKDLKIAIQPYKKLNKKISNYILSGIKLQSDIQTQTLTLIATDLEISIKTKIPAIVMANGSAIIPFKNLEKLSDVKSETIDIELTPGEKESDPETLNIYKLKLNTFDKEEFPEYPVIKNPKTLYSLNLTNFKKALQKTNPYISTDPSRVMLTGFYCDLANSKIVATDSYKLALHDFDFNHIDYYNSTEPENRHLPQLNFVLPQRIYQILNTIKENPNQTFDIVLDEETIQISDPNEPNKYKTNQVKINTENVEIVSYTISGKFPDYQKLIPNQDSFKTILSINAQTLTNTLTEAEKLLQIDNIPVKLILINQTNPKLDIELNVRETGKFQDSLPVNIIQDNTIIYQIIDNENTIRTTESTQAAAQAWINLHKDYYKNDDGTYLTYRINETENPEKLIIAFNPAYLKICLQNTENPIISIVDPLRPVTIKDTEAPEMLSLLMPIRIS
jgi:DNA polymerase-3 subunit beta